MPPWGVVSARGRTDGWKGGRFVASRPTAEFLEKLNSLPGSWVLLENKEVHGVKVRLPLDVYLLALLVHRVVLVVGVGSIGRRLGKVGLADSVGGQGAEEKDECSSPHCGLWGKKLQDGLTISAVCIPPAQQDKFTTASRAGKKRKREAVQRARQSLSFEKGEAASDARWPWCQQADAHMSSSLWRRTMSCKTSC